jgi:hypothetical protein
MFQTTNIILDEEFKKLVYQEMITAQDTNSPCYFKSFYAKYNL